MNTGFLNDMNNIFKYILQTLFVILIKFIKMFIDFSKHMGDPGINSGLPTLENSFGKLGEIYSSLEESIMKEYAMDQYHS